MIVLMSVNTWGEEYAREALGCATRLSVSGKIGWFDTESSCFKALVSRGAPTTPRPVSPSQHCDSCKDHRGNSLQVRGLYVLCAAKQRKCSCPNGEVILRPGHCPLRIF